jgi:hypothetical protein
MKGKERKSNNQPGQRFRGLRLWFCEMRLRFDLRYSRNFKRFCEKRGYLNLADMEEKYIRDVQNSIAEIQQRRRH